MNRWNSGRQRSFIFRVVAIVCAVLVAASAFLFLFFG